MVLSNKERAINLIKNMANDVTLHEIVYQLAMEERLEQAAQDSAAGRVLTQEEIRARFKHWLD